MRGTSWDILRVFVRHARRYVGRAGVALVTAAVSVIAQRLWNIQASGFIR